MHKIRTVSLSLFFLLLLLILPNCYVPPPDNGCKAGSNCADAPASSESGQSEPAAQTDASTTPEQGTTPDQNTTPETTTPESVTPETTTQPEQGQADKPGPQCKATCASPDDCKDTACKYCIVSSTGKSSCSTTRSCGMMCKEKADCPEGCTRCKENRCVKAVGCGSRCEQDSDCAENCGKCRKIPFSSKRVCSV